MKPFVPLARHPHFNMNKKSIRLSCRNVLDVASTSTAGTARQSAIGAGTGASGGRPRHGALELNLPQPAQSERAQADVPQPPAKLFKPHYSTGTKDVMMRRSK